MLPNLEEAEKRVRLQKQQTSKAEYELQKLKLQHKVANLDKEIAIQEDSINKLKQELGE